MVRWYIVDGIKTTLRCACLHGVVQIIGILTLLGSEVRIISQPISSWLTLGTDRLRLVFTGWVGSSSSPIAWPPSPFPPSRLWGQTRVKKQNRKTSRDLRLYCNLVQSSHAGKCGDGLLTHRRAGGREEGRGNSPWSRARYTYSRHQHVLVLVVVVRSTVTAGV